MKLLSFLAYVVVRVLTATLRIRHVGQEHIDSTPQYILAFWHAQLMPVLGRSRWRKPITVMVSRSDDGELIAQVLARFGVESARGSSSRGGGAALRDMLRDAREGKNIVFTPDGPRGPACVVKEGVIYAAKASGLPIVPLACATRSRRLLGSWDRMMLPYPFTRGAIVYGEPLAVPRDGDVEEWRILLENRLNELTAEAERLTGGGTMKDEG
jgi:lysophospholipid acyltransferase (LPLAT)-like uncharacterized protein